MVTEETSVSIQVLFKLALLPGYQFATGACSAALSDHCSVSLQPLNKPIMVAGSSLNWQVSVVHNLKAIHSVHVGAEDALRERLVHVAS